MRCKRSRWQLLDAEWPYAYNLGAVNQLLTSPSLQSLASIQTAKVLYVDLAFPSTPIGCQIRAMAMPLCKLCQKISRQDWKIVPLKPEGEWLQHHQTYGNLCKSALEGWGLYILLKNGPLDWAGTHANKLYKWRNGPVPRVGSAACQT